MWIAIVIKPLADVDTICFFETQSEVEKFGLDTTSYTALDPEDNPDHWQNYDPPIVLVLEAKTKDAFETGKYDRPVAIYQRGTKFHCLPPD